MIFIYDKNGYIAGMQSVVPKEDTYEDKYYKFSSSPMYNLDKLNDTQVLNLYIFFHLDSSSPQFEITILFFLIQILSFVGIPHNRLFCGS